MKDQGLTRRAFLAATTTSVLLAGYAGAQKPNTAKVVPRKLSPNEKLNVAGIGVGGMGKGDIMNCTSENIVALCDVDAKQAEETFYKLSSAKQYKDYRKMLEEMDKEIDAVTVSTPDHTHAPAAYMAMMMGKHVRVQKPLTHTIAEARLLAKTAKETGVVSQMGNQGHAGNGVRELCEALWAGAIGDVKEAHIWTNRPIWPQGISKPYKEEKVPETMEWDLWIGSAPERPYNHKYAPFNWRGWWDFGCGAMGDMAVHNADPAFFCLDLDAPTAVEAETSGSNDETLPKWSIITYEFPAKGNRPAVKMVWYDGAKMPPRPPELEEGRKLEDNGILFVGDKGKMVCGGWSGPPRLIPESRMKEYKKPEKTLPRSPGHHKEWIDACKAGKPEMAMAGFWYSGPFTESLLVGNLAVRLGRRVEWDSKMMRSPNCPEADNYVTKFYRAGFDLVS